MKRWGRRWTSTALPWCVHQTDRPVCPAVLFHVRRDSRCGLSCVFAFHKAQLLLRPCVRQGRERRPGSTEYVRIGTRGRRGGGVCRGLVGATSESESRRTLACGGRFAFQYWPCAERDRLLTLGRWMPARTHQSKYYDWLQAG